jgi:Beta-lactamase class C and other penicillin binding proteins
MKTTKLLPVLFFACCFLFGCKDGTRSTSTVTDFLPRSTPEQEGVSSKGIIDFIDAVEASGQEIHSFMLLRHGKVVAEGWWAPHTPEELHTMFSVSKSFTSSAVGYAITEGLLSLSDEVVSFFPEYVPEDASTFLIQMTVRDLLTMSAGQDPDPTSQIRQQENWIKAFFETPVIKQPGRVYLYNSAATYMLSAIVQKVTGENVMDYLKPRLFDPLYIKGIDWETDPMGINTGGWGLRLKTEDMAKFGQLLLQKGKWNGKQILSQEWIEEATSFKIDQRPDLSPEEKAKDYWALGYCYQFWISPNNTFRADGARGQLILVMPELDAVLVITANASEMPVEYDLVWNFIYPAISEGKKLPANEPDLTVLKQKLASLKISTPEN